MVVACRPFVTVVRCIAWRRRCTPTPQATPHYLLPTRALYPPTACLEPLIFRCLNTVLDDVIRTMNLDALPAVTFSDVLTTTLRADVLYFCCSYILFLPILRFFNTHFHHTTVPVGWWVCAFVAYLPWFGCSYRTFVTTCLRHAAFALQFFVRPRRVETALPLVPTTWFPLPVVLVTDGCYACV